MSRAVRICTPAGRTGGPRAALWLKSIKLIVDLFFFFQVHTTQSKAREEDEGPDHDDKAPDVSEDSLFEHVKKVDKFHDALTKDAATEEQAKEQLMASEKEDEKDPDKEDEEEEDVITKDEQQEEEIDHQIDQVDAEKLAQSKKKGKRQGDPKAMDQDEEEHKMEGIGKFQFNSLGFHWIHFLFNQIHYYLFIN